MFTRGQLDQLVLDVELVLISVVQGVALSTLAIEAGPRMGAPDALTLVFVATGLLFVLSFWSVAIIHAISFVVWPMDLGHYFFYFALALLECLTFAQMERPVAWFAWSLACFGVTCVLYAYDYALILRRRAAFEDKALYAHILKHQKFEMLALMPAGLAFNLVAYLVVRGNVELALPLASVQLLFTLLFVVNFARTFEARRRLITAAAI